MKKPLFPALLALGVFAVIPAQAQDLGLIRVESSTIADRFEDKRAEPSTTAVISGAEVDREHSENIQQLLQGIPGITTELQSGDSLKIHIRGVENQRFMGEKPGVAVVIDGVPVFERTGRVNIDLDNIESIKVVKGGASYLFGEDALSGAVIITTKRGADLTGARVAAEAGSFGYKKGLVRVGQSGVNWAGHLQASRRESEGYYFQSDYRADYLNGKFQYYLDDVSDLTFGFEHSDRRKDSHGAVEGVTQALQDPRSENGRDYARRFDVTLGKFFTTWSRDLGSDANLSVNLYQFTDSTGFVSAPQDYSASGTPVTDVDAYTTGNAYDQTQRGIKGEYRAGGETLAWMAGLDLRANRYENAARYLVDFKRSPRSSTVYTAGTVVADDLTDETVQALYGELKFRAAERLTLTLNGRHDRIALDYQDRLSNLNLDKSFNVNSWRTGANYALRDNQDLYANVSTGFRTPTVQQLFAGDISPFGDTASNSDLKPEQSLNFELGLRGRSEWAGVEVDYDAAAFRLQRDDFIMNAAGNYAVPESGVKDQYDNIGGMVSDGLELSLSTDRRRELFADIAYTFLQSRYTRYDQYNLVLGNRYQNPVVEVYRDLSGNTVPRAPEHHLNVSLGTRLTPALVLSAEADYQSGYYADDLNRFRMPERTVLNLRANYATRLQGGDRIELFARIDNLLDRRYYNTARATGDGDQDGDFDQEDLSLVVNQGRTYTVGLAWAF